MKIIAYSVRSEEIPMIDEFATSNNLTIDYLNEDLDINSVVKAKGYDGISIQQSAAIKDEEIFKQLADFGFKQLSTRTAGYDMIDLALAKKYNLLVSHVPAYSPNAIAELALTQTMNLVRNMYLTNPRIARNDFTWKGLMAPEIRSLVVGIIGVGRIGSVYAKLISGLGAKVIGYDIKIDPDNESIVEYQASLEDLLRKSDVISIHTPLNDSTKDLINSKTISLMKDGAYLINSARGGIINTQDLIDALESKKLAGVALDTISCEVPYFSKDYSNKEIEDLDLVKLLAMENVLITPHIAFYTKTAVQNMVEIGLQGVLDILTTNTSQYLIKI